MTTKKNIALFWGASCGGCEIAVLDTNEKVLDVAAAANIVLWPIAVDGKYADIEALPDGTIDFCFFNGGVRNNETEHIARLLRKKSKVMVSFGACANLGGVPGLANQTNRESILKRVYESTESADNPGHVRPQAATMVKEGELTLPELYERVLPLHEVVQVDYSLPGCPPTAENVAAALDAVISGNLPPAGSVIGGVKTVCDECPRERRNERTINKFYRPHEIITDPKRCLLEQGVICCGPATRGGCKASCCSVNMPCRGCYGAPPGVTDQGATMLSAVTSLIDADEEEDINRIIADIKDPLGVFYQFGLGVSLLKGSFEKVYGGPEKRKHLRAKTSLVVSYRVLEEPVVDDQLSGERISQSRNVSLGGMLITTNRRFNNGTKLALEINLPTDPHPFSLIGRVVESGEVVKDLVYDTRLEFIAVDEEHREMLTRNAEENEANA